MKKILLSLMLISPSVYANFDPVKEGLPLPDGGIKVISMKKMTSLRSSEHIQVLKAHNAIEEKGFYEADDKDANLLYNLRNFDVKPAGSNDPADTSLKANIEDIGLAFEYKGLPVSRESIVGYAAAGAHNKGGWTGVVGVFTDKDLGTCRYTLDVLRLSHASEFIPEEVVRKDVNNKVTTLDVRGSANSGFLYSIHWADKNAMNDLECATLSFHKSKKEKIIALAKKIDNY